MNTNQIITNPSQMNEPWEWKVLIWFCRVLLLNIAGCFFDFNGFIVQSGQGSFPWNKLLKIVNKNYIKKHKMANNNTDKPIFCILILTNQKI